MFQKGAKGGQKRTEPLWDTPILFCLRTTPGNVWLGLLLHYCTQHPLHSCSLRTEDRSYAFAGYTYICHVSARTAMTAYTTLYCYY